MGLVQVALAHDTVSCNCGLHIFVTRLVLAQSSAFAEISDTTLLMFLQILSLFCQACSFVANHSFVGTLAHLEPFQAS